MTHTFYAALGALAIAGSSTLWAQTEVPSAVRPQTAKPSASTPSSTVDKTMTVTGCLKAQDASDAGRLNSTTPSGPATVSKFVLTNVRGDSMATPTPGATAPGTPAASATAQGVGKQYALTAEAGVNLAAHLNHQVRVTGKLNPVTPVDPVATPGDPLKPDSTASPGEAPQPGERMEQTWPTLAVSSVTMISSSCTGATR